MAHNFQRPNLPYEAESLPNNKRYQLLTRSNNRPPTDVMLDTDVNYLIDAVRQLDDDIATIEAEGIAGADDPANANSLVTTDGAGNIGWVKVQDSNIQTHSITNLSIMPQTITATEIQDGTITSGKIADGAVGTPKIADVSVTSDKIAIGAVSAPEIATSAVTTAKIRDLNVTTGKIADSAVTGIKIGSLAVSSGKIADSAVTAAKLASGAVTSAKIASGAVTTAELGSQAVTAAKIANDTITFTQINSSFTATKAQQQAASSSSVYVSPARQQDHPSAASFWCCFDGTATGTNAPLAGYNVSSVVRNSSGNYTINYTNSFSSSNYCVVSTGGTSAYTSIIQTLSSSSCNIVTREPDGSNLDQSLLCVVGFGVLA